MLIILSGSGPEHQRQPLRTRRHRRRDHRRHPAQRRPGHHHRLRARRPGLHHDHQHLRPEQPAERRPADRQGRDHRRRRAGPAPYRAARPERDRVHRHATSTTSSQPSTSRRGLLFGTAAVVRRSPPHRLHQQRAQGRRAGRAERPAGRRRQARQARHHRLRRPAGRPRLAQRHQRQRQERGRRSTRTSPWRSPRAPTTPPPRSARSRPSSTRRSTSWSILPADGKALTQVGLKAMKRRHPRRQPRPHLRLPAGLPLLDRRRQLRHGPQRRPLHRRAAQGQDERQGRRARRASTTWSSPSSAAKGFDDALKNYPNIKKVARQAADFTVESGQAKMAQLLQAQKQFDALWNHDDDQGVGALRAIQQAGRDEFLMVGGAGAQVRDGGHQGRQQRPEGHRPLPADDGRLRDRPGPRARPGQGHRAASPRWRSRPR